MKLATTFRLLVSLFAFQTAAHPSAFPTKASANALDPAGGLIVTETPDELRPYVLPKNFGTSQWLGNQVMRFPVTGNSSAGGFTILQTSSLQSDTYGPEPHLHKKYYETFYCSRGRIQLWTKSNTSNAEQNTRVLTAGDLGAVPHNTIHTFQYLEPDTMFTTVVQPGGFEQLFLYGGDRPYISAVGSTFPPEEFDLPSGGNPTPDEVNQFYDHWAEHSFTPRTDAVNGMAGSGNWHNGPNELAPDSDTPFYVAKDWGAKYLNSDDGVYKIVAPLHTAATTAGNLTMGTITMSPLLPNGTVSEVTFTEHISFVMEEGELVVIVNNETASMVTGDIAFIPAGTPFTYYAISAATRVLYVQPGREGLQSQLLENSIPWNFISYPQYAP